MMREGAPHRDRSWSWRESDCLIGSGRKCVRCVRAYAPVSQRPRCDRRPAEPASASRIRFGILRGRFAPSAGSHGGLCEPGVARAGWRASGVLCIPPSAVLWALIKLFYRPRADRKGPAKLPYGDYFAALYHYPFDEIHANVFDQLVTPVAYYLREEEVRPWLASGFRDATLRSHRGYSWTGLATVCRTKAAVAE